MSRFPRNTVVPRPVDDVDRHKIMRELSLRCKAGSFVALRLRAMVLLAGGSGLRISEICSLDTVQVLEDPTAPRWKIRSVGYLRKHQAKGRAKGERTWNSAGPFLLGDDVRHALRAYISECRRRKWISWPPVAGDPLFVGVRGNRTLGVEPGKRRIVARSVQKDWKALQIRAGVPTLYHFHCLRHDAMTRASDVIGGNPYKLAEYGRCDVVTAMRYIHTRPKEMISLRNRIAFSR